MGCTGGHPPVSQRKINVTNRPCQAKAPTVNAGICPPAFVTPRPLTRRRRRQRRTRHARKVPRAKEKHCHAINPDVGGCTLELKAFPVPSQHDQFASNHKSVCGTEPGTGPGNPGHFQSGLRFSGRGPEAAKGNPHARRGRGSVFAGTVRRKSANSQALSRARQVTALFFID